MEINIRLTKEDDFIQIFELLEQLWPNQSQDKCERIELDSAFHRIEAHEFYKKMVSRTGHTYFQK